MGTGYTRNDVTNNIADGNIISASDIDGEYDAIEAAFNESTGHTHDGTAAEGAPITVLGPVQDFVASATEIKPKTTNTLDIGTLSLQFKDMYLDGTAYIDGLGEDILVATDKKVQFRDTALFINSSVDGQLDIDADVELELVAPTVDIDASTAVTIDTATLTITGSANVTGDLDVDNININGNTISSTDTNGNITLAPNGTGVVALSSTDLTFGDNDKAIFGAGSDLKIYHDGLKSVIEDVGTGDLVVRAGNLYINNAAGTENMVHAVNNGAVTLYYDNAAKLATTSSGIDVTGTVTADSLTVDGNALIDQGALSGNTLSLDRTGASGSLGLFYNGTQGALIQTPSGGGFDFYTGSSPSLKMSIDSSGNVGIGTSSPAAPIHALANSGDMLRLDRNNTGAVGNQIAFRHSNAGTLTETASINAVSTANADTGTLQFYTKTSGGSNTERLRIDSSGNVGIGTTSPFTNIGFPIGNDIKISQVASTAHQAGNAGSIGLTISDGGGHSGIFVNNSHDGTYSDQFITFKTAEGGVSSATERMRIDSSGNVGIGTASPTANLDVEAASGDATLRVHAAENNSSSEPILVLESSNDFAESIVEFKDSSGVGGRVAYNHGDNALRFQTNGTSERMRIDSSGNVGINTSSPNSNAFLHVSGNGDPSASMGVKGLMLSYSSGNSAPIYFGTETDSSAKAIYMRSFYMTIRGHENEGVKFDGSGSSVTRYQFNMGNNGSTCFNASNSSSWNTTSDSRIKENVQSLPDGAIEKIKALRPVTFDYTDDWATQKGWFSYTASEDDPHELTENGFNLEQKNNDIGWIAQEYETVFPEDVKNSTQTVGGVEVNDFKTLKPDSLVPHLVKALQEAVAKIEALEENQVALEARITALENA